MLKFQTCPTEYSVNAEMLNPERKMMTIKPLICEHEWAFGFIQMECRPASEFGTPWPDLGIEEYCKKCGEFKPREEEQ